MESVLRNISATFLTFDSICSLEIASVSAVFHHGHFPIYEFMEFLVTMTCAVAVFSFKGIEIHVLY